MFETSSSWKSDCLRFGMLPLKAYVIGVPFVLALWKMAFQEPDPRGWDMRDAGTYNGLLAEIFKTLELGYLLGTFLEHPPIVSLEIPDEFEYMDEELIKLIREGVEFHLRQEFGFE